METFTGLGFMLGPPLGGVLYSVSKTNAECNKNLWTSSPKVFVQKSLDNHQEKVGSPKPKSACPKRFKQ